MVERGSPPVRQVDIEPRPVILTAKCEMCDWQVSLPSNIVNMVNDSLKLGQSVDKHQAETGHSVRTFQTAPFSSNTP